MSHPFGAVVWNDEDGVKQAAKGAGPCAYDRTEWPPEASGYSAAAAPQHHLKRFTLIYAALHTDRAASMRTSSGLRMEMKDDRREFGCGRR